MLEHIFGSRTRLKLLGLFVHHPEEPFYVRELTRRIDTQINAVRREIQNLVDIGFLVQGSALDGPASKKTPGLKRKYYRVNAHFPLLQEIRSLLLKAHVFVERKMDQELLRLGKVQYLAFLGAFLGLRQQPVDLFIVGNIPQAKLQKFIAEIGKELECDINYTCMTPQEYAYRKEVADRFLHAILQAPKHVVVNSLEV